MNNEIMSVEINKSLPQELDSMSTTEKLDYFTKQYTTVFMKIREMNEMKKQLEDSLNDIKESLGQMMEKYDIKSISNSLINISRVEASSSTTFDLAKLKKEDSELYTKLFERYHKTTNKKAYTKIVT